MRELKQAYDIFKSALETITMRKIIEPYLDKHRKQKELESKTEEALVSAQTEVYVEEIRDGRRKIKLPGGIDSKFLPINPEPKPISLAREYPAEPKFDPILVKEILHIDLAKTTRETENVLNALLIAEDEIISGNSDEKHDSAFAKGDTPNLEDALDIDWLWKWRNSASSTSQDYMQLIWGKILAGEIKNPKTFSMRTLNTISNLSQNDAERLSIIKKFIINGDSIYWNTEIIDNKNGIDGIKLNDLLWLEELNIIAGGASNALAITITSRNDKYFGSSILMSGAEYLVLHEDKNMTINIPVCTLTSVGLEILKLLQDNQNERYTTALVEFIASKGFSVLKKIIIHGNGGENLASIQHIGGPEWDIAQERFKKNS
jgi:hypothetical protein